MNRTRRIAVMPAGLAAAVLALTAPAPPALAARVPPPAGDAQHTARNPLHECPSALATHPRVGKAWEHRRKYGGVGPAVGGWCLLSKADRYTFHTTLYNLRASR
jgi:hypothetical protein